MIQACVLVYNTQLTLNDIKVRVTLVNIVVRHVRHSLHKHGWEYALRGVTAPRYSDTVFQCKQKWFNGGTVVVQRYSNTLA